MKIAIIIITALALLTGAFFFGKGQTKPGQTVVEYDTMLVDKLVYKTERDTVIKWYERIVYQKSEPEKIFVKDVDSVFIEKWRNHDVMLSVTKRGSQLDIFALNEIGQVLKRYTYEDVQRDFTVTSQEDNLFVKSKNWYWESPEVFAGIGTSRSTYENLDVKKLQLKQFDYRGGIRTGLNYKDKIGIELEGITDTDLNWQAFINLKYKF